MPVINRIAEFAEDMKTWRRDLHRHPELAFEETRTADLVAEKLAGWGIEVHRGLAKTGVVGLLEGRGETGDKDTMIGLRADLDALPMDELNDFPHRSRHEGRMHACGHDGHTAMLLGAARYLAETRNFSGRVAFIFQPAEEAGGGGQVMVQEGLFELFPVRAVYGLHNMPGFPVGQVALRSGSILAAADVARITVIGRGGHAAMPHMAVDPVVIAAQIVTALQTLASRRSDPLDSLVVSITNFHAGSAENVIPETAELVASVRSLKPATRDWLEREIATLAEGIAAAQGARAEVLYQRGYPATVNTAEETARAARAAARVVGPDRVHEGIAPLMGSEDFAFLLQARPGCYILLGNGVGEDGAAGGEGHPLDHPGGCSVHNPRYDFNDEIAVIGASYWASLAEQELPREEGSG